MRPYCGKNRKVRTAWIRTDVTTNHETFSLALLISIAFVLSSQSLSSHTQSLHSIHSVPHAIHPYHRQQRPGLHDGAAAAQKSDEEHQSTGQDEDVGTVFHDGGLIELLQALVFRHSRQQEEGGVVHGQPDAEGQYHASSSLW